MKALLDYSKIEKYIIYNDMTKGSFCKNAGISYSTLKNVENEKGIAVASAQKIAAALHRLSKKNKSADFPADYLIE